MNFDSRAERTGKVYFLKGVSDDFQYDNLSTRFLEKFGTVGRRGFLARRSFSPFPKMNREKNTKGTNQRETFSTFGYKSTEEEGWIPTG